MVAIVPYNDIRSMKPLEAVDYILKHQKWKFKELKPSGLFCELTMNKKFIDLNYTDIYLKGIYLFFDGNSIRYIGKAKDGFYSRFMGHTDTTFKANFGWNALLRKIGSYRTGKMPNDLTTKDHDKDFYTMIEYNLVVIDVDRKDYNLNEFTIHRLEKIMMRSFEAVQPGHLLNTRFGKYDLDYDKFNLKKLAE